MLDRKAIFTMYEVPHNEHYQVDVKISLQLTRNILLALGAWPNFDGKRSTCEKISKSLRIFVSYALLYYALVPGVFYWIREKRVSARLRMTTIMLYGFMTVVKYYILIIHESKIRRCLKLLEEDWKNVDNACTRNVMLEFAKLGKRLITICAVFLYSSGLSLRTLIPLSRGKIVTPQNVTIRPLPYPTYLFSIDVQSSPIYETVFTMQCLSGVVTVSIGISIYGLIVIFVMHACGQLKILINQIKSLVEKQQQDELEVNKKLAIIVEHQVRIRSFLQLVEDTLQHMIFIEIGGATVITCVSSYYILMEWQSSNSLAMCSYFITLSAATISMFIFCYTGEQLITQAEQVALTSCELEWYRLPDKKARGIVLVMIMSNIPIKITAGKLIVLSFKTFGDILKTAAAYFNVLRNVIN